MSIIFNKPIISKNKEKLIKYEDFYYVVKLKNYSKIMNKYGINRGGGGGNWNHLNFVNSDWYQNGKRQFFSKDEIDRLPRHLRRGGEYGHDSVLIKRSYNASDNNAKILYCKKMCKIYNIALIFK